jgi:RNAse (barnase) inhibitor barstar
VLVIDGADFSDLDGFTREFSRLLVNYTWRGNLDAFNDLLRGGFGTPENGWVLRWLNSELSRSALGYEATIQRLEQVLLTCHPSHRLNSERRIRRARRGQGPTLFDEIVDIIREHGPGGRESEDSIVLELV